MSDDFWSKVGTPDFDWEKFREIYPRRAEQPTHECPNCGKWVGFTDEEREEDDHHLEKHCPHCGKLCCFVCQHVYG